jgi:uncharacterized protein
VNEILPSYETALTFLSDLGCSIRVIAHCKAVSALAVQFAETCKEKGFNVDVNLVEIGALLHDIGRSKTHDVNHAVVGAEIAKTLNLPESVVSIIECHIGGGITAEEAKDIGLPIRDYFPITLEEKLVAYVDKLIEGSRVVPIEHAIEQFSKKLGEHHLAIDRIMSLHEELLQILGDLNVNSYSA